MISVVIPAYNEEDAIGVCLSSLVKQKYDKPFEVVLVDNNSTDRTIEVAKKFSKKLTLKIIEEKRQGRGSAKWRGAKEASGDIFAYLDADTRALADWLSTIDNAFLDPRIAAISGSWRVYDLPKGFTRWFLHTFQEVAMLPITLILMHPNLNGMNMAFRKSIYKKSGGFDRSLNVHDDFDLARRIGRVGRIKYIRKLRVLTSGRRYKNGIIRGILSYHRGTLNFLLHKSADLEDIR